ncbi:carbohydrate ABC transporter permease [Ruminiclostridium cellobioparum]|jgi:putative aldouronate transport system permease protein|uniref:ABC-type sugar transport system, permease component n=1 Tax=Ruminiclostridium cellobioparum subsp. termitidis CT1112 TaxID=1195236 RepID=S0FQX6_RUMCE|nr:carbohydrate ABC transporter permease [Ruminiclostridium cellobioparum]EMS71584.1 ABC-type sugar transport system, permease component [Ruminiclostridium cellobioparum subsp. termitidis CT1112]
MKIGKKNLSAENVIFTTLNSTFLILLSVAMIYPMLNTLAISFNEGMDTVRGGIYLWPRIFSLQNYRVVFHMDTIYGAFMISVLKTIVIVITNLFFTSMLAYALSRREFIFRKSITVLFVMTMYFNAGLIPNYMLIRDLHMINTFTVYWLPNIISAFNLIVIRTYIRSIPESFIESAKIDGAREFRIFLQIILPLCVPTLATIALFVAVGSWNSWFDTFLYNSAKQSLSTLQYELQKLLASAMNAGNTSAGVGAAAAQSGAGNVTTPQSIRAAITIVVAVPILLVYPFLQRYFVNGLALGGVKG